VAIPAPIGILGGTFDPPHVAHLVLGECARVALGLERVLFIPAGGPWMKADRAGLSAREHRLAMTALAVAGNASFAVDDRECRRAGASYTVDTLEELAADGIVRPWLILGADAAGDLSRWKSPERVLELARVAVAPRLEASPLPPGAVVLDMPHLEISSTDIRRRVAKGLPIRYLVPASVEAYIWEHGLFRRGSRG